MGELRSEVNIDYKPLESLLTQQNFEQADRLTALLMRQLVGEPALNRGWIYFTEIALISNTDFKTINELWLNHSNGKFGFSVQRKIWLGLDKNWEKFWQQIGWKQAGSFTRYPNEFTWTLEAPKGHLPLSNQIRGNKTITAIFSHPTWTA